MTDFDSHELVLMLVFVANVRLILTDNIEIFILWNIIKTFCKGSNEKVPDYLNGFSDEDEI